MENTENTGYIYEGLDPRALTFGAPDLPDLLGGRTSWSTFRPKFETQRKFGMDSMNCVQCSRAKLCEYLANYYGIPLDISERFWYWLTGCTERGNTYSRCDYHIRQGGAVADERWPWDRAMSRGEYGMDPPADLVIEANKFFEKWTFGSLYYVPSTIPAFRAALKKGPLWFANIGHSMVMEDVDDRIRVFDTEANATDGIGSFPLDYAPNIVCAYLAPFTPKSSVVIPVAHILLPENCLVTGVMSDGLSLALYVGGKLLLGDRDLVLSQWIARNEDAVEHRFNGGPTRTISEADWSAFERLDFKGNPV